MADWNNKPEFQDKKLEKKDIDKIIISTVDYTEKRCRRQFRKWLAEKVIIVSGISLWIKLICMMVERAKVLSTESYRDMNELELIFAVLIILSFAFAVHVRETNM